MVVPISTTTSIASTVSSPTSSVAFSLPISSFWRESLFCIAPSLTIASLLLISCLFRKLNAVPVSVLSHSLSLPVLAAALSTSRPPFLSFQGSNPRILLFAPFLRLDILLFATSLFLHILLLFLTVLLVFFVLLSFLFPTSFVVLLYSVPVQLK